jgi:hypothetical protein
MEGWAHMTIRIQRLRNVSFILRNVRNPKDLGVSITRGLSLTHGVHQPPVRILRLAGGGGDPARRDHSGVQRAPGDPSYRVPARPSL